MSYFVGKLGETNKRLGHGMMGAQQHSVLQTETV